MKKGFGTRRIVKKIGQEDEEETSDSLGTSGTSDAEEQKPTRPAISKLKKKSKLRLSFGPGEVNPDATSDDADAESAVFTPKKSNLSRIASAKNAERKSLRPALSSEDLAFRAGNAIDRPSYSKDYLAQLKQSTPSTPKSHLSEDDASKKDLDIASKFGPLTTLGANKSAIPSATEIKEKKERRARLAKEQEYISMHPSDSEEERLDLIMQPKEKYPETRLVREDEDILEGFDDFVEDGRIALGRKAEREEKRKKREEMEAMILQAEGAGSDGSIASEDESEVERNEAYEAAQTRAGTYGSKREGGDGIKRPKTPPKVTAVPELGAVLLKLRQGLAEMEQAKLAKIRKLEELKLEKKGILEQEVWIQGQLKETGERYEKLRIEAEAAGAPANGDNGELERGLDHLGTTPLVTTPAATTPAAYPGEASDEEEENPGFVGFSMTLELRMACIGPHNTAASVTYNYNHHSFRYCVATVEFIGGFFRTYPTNTILYPNGVRASGTYNTSSQCVTLPGTIIWPSSALSSLTQDSPTLPAGETDHYGIMYTVGERGAQYPSGFVRAQQKAGVIPTQCNLASVAPAAAVQGVLVLTSTSISTLQNAKTTEQASSTIANPVVQTATSTSLPTLQDTKTTDQASKTTAKPIKQTTSSTVTPPSQSSSLIPSAVVSPLTTAITTLPMSAESASSISQTMNSLPTPQQSPWPSVDTAVQTKSPTVPQTTITAPDSLLQSSKPSSRASTEITSAQTSPTANTVPAVLDTEYAHPDPSRSTTGSSSVAPFASIVMSTSDTTSIIPHSSSILNSTPPDLASPTAITSTGLDVGAYIMSGLGV
ncbi:hypothetical protein EG327_007807 [Venturia inaequalis]|uniref:Uncharacterized protein n=1 Tax=Venturia inaequalis TaxID=5025 RepID=A0A8H3YZ25_VENIN|nr:hypothetical protein EG327_007807 [Venturia inaequalis]